MTFTLVDLVVKKTLEGSGGKKKQEDRSVELRFMEDFTIALIRKRSVDAYYIFLLNLRTTFPQSLSLSARCDIFFKITLRV